VIENDDSERKSAVESSFLSGMDTRTSIPTFQHPAGRHGQCSSRDMASLTSSGNQKEILMRVLGIKGTSGESRSEPKRFSDISSLLQSDKEGRVDGYHRKVSLSKFKLKDTICTDGLMLNLLAYDTTQQKRRSKSADQGEADMIVDLSEELELEDGVLGKTAFKQEGEELSSGGLQEHQLEERVGTP
ncbi:hypothetical protein BGZ65_009087, partial [Modicella reniformis]